MELPSPPKIFHINSYFVEQPTEMEIRAFFSSLFEDAQRPMAHRQYRRRNPLPVLDPVPFAPSYHEESKEEEERKRVERENQQSLRELRIFLRDCLQFLYKERRFLIFFKPVNAEQYPEYYEAVNNHLDLSIILERIDNHHYLSLQPFLDDIELMINNFIQFHPLVDSMQIVNKARALHDLLLSMTYHFDPELLARCDRIAEEYAKANHNEEALITIDQSHESSLLLTEQQSSVDQETPVPAMTSDHCNENSDHHHPNPNPNPNDNRNQKRNHQHRQERFPVEESLGNSDRMRSSARIRGEEVKLFELPLTNKRRRKGERKDRHKSKKNSEEKQQTQRSEESSSYVPRRKDDNHADLPNHSSHMDSVPSNDVVSLSREDCNGIVSIQDKTDETLGISGDKWQSTRTPEGLPPAADMRADHGTKRKLPYEVEASNEDERRTLANGSEEIIVGAEKDSRTFNKDPLSEWRTEWDPVIAEQLMVRLQSLRCSLEELLSLHARLSQILLDHRRKSSNANAVFKEWNALLGFLP